MPLLSVGPSGMTLYLQVVGAAMSYPLSLTCLARPVRLECNSRGHPGGPESGFLLAPYPLSRPGS